MSKNQPTHQGSGKTRWAKSYAAFALNLRTYAIPYIVTLIYLTMIAVSQYLAVSKQSYLDYWDALLTLTELRWLIPIALGFPLSFFGLWFAHRRFEQASKQLDLQIRSQNQQRFFDAVRLLDSDNTAIQFGALETIQQIARSEVGEFTDECLAILNTFLGQNSQGFAWESERLSIASAEESAPTQ